MKLSNVKVMLFLIWTRLIGNIHQQRTSMYSHMGCLHVLVDVYMFLLMFTCSC